MHVRAELGERKPYLAPDLACADVREQLPHALAVGHAVLLLTCTAMHQQLQVTTQGPAARPAEEGRQ